MRSLPRHQSEEIAELFFAEHGYSIDQCWLMSARPQQFLPPGDWRTWLILAGRGFGKTRTGSETIRQWVKEFQYVNIMGATSADARDIMIEGESGILACCPPDERPEYIANKNLLRWPNGARSLIFSADKPDRLRGKQHEKLLVDELAAWRYPESYTQALLGLRLGKSPQSLIMTTPRPIKIIKDLLKDPTTFVTRGSTYDNRANLAPQFIAEIIKKYEGTRIGRQELYAEVLDDNPSALWKRDRIDKLRVRLVPQDLRRIVVAIDPAVTSSDSSCETGIIVAGVDSMHHGYILEDCSMQGTADEWAARAVRAYHEWRADRIIGEANNGGDLIEAVIRTKDRNVSYKKVHASRGKTKRAEPISATYEQDRVHHVGSFPQLEDQMCLPAGTLIETQRGQVPIEDMQLSDLVMTREGLAPIKWSGQTGLEKDFVLVLHEHGCVIMTECHPIFLHCQSEFASAKLVQVGQNLRVSRKWVSMDRQCIGGGVGGIEWYLDTLDTQEESCCTEQSGKHISGQSLMESIFTTETKTQEITSCPTSSQSHLKNMTIVTPQRALDCLTQKPDLFMQKSSGQQSQQSCIPAKFANQNLNQSEHTHCIVPVSAKEKLSTKDGKPIQVFNISVADGYLPEFYANGVLVHNCAWNPQLSDSEQESPDRMDALVWALSDLMLKPTKEFLVV